LRYFAIILLLAVAAAVQSSAQNSTQADSASATKGQASASAAAADLASQVPAPKSDDVKSMDALLHAIYDVISGPAGDRDWNRFRSLFVPQARFTKAAKNPDGSVAVRLLSVDDFVSVAGGRVQERAIL
jgi:hypothetical protein